MKYHIIVLVIFVAMVFIIDAGFIEVFAELNEEQIKNLIKEGVKEGVGELNRWDKWIGWILSAIGTGVAVVTFYFGYKIGLLPYFNKRFGKIEKTVARIEGKIEKTVARIEGKIDNISERCQRLEDQISNLQMLQTVVLFILGIALIAIGAHLLINLM